MKTPERTGQGLRGGRDGFALVFVLWFLGLVTALVALGEVYARLHREIGRSVTHLHRARTLARSGTEAWMGQLRVDARENDPDHHGENWGWGGRLARGVPVNVPVYLPSFAVNARPGDYGFFLVQRIEDLSGKINLMVEGSDTHPRFDTRRDRPFDTGVYRVRGAGGVYYRNLSADAAGSVIRYARAKTPTNGDTWWSPGELLTNEPDGSSGSLVAGSASTWHESTQVTTGLNPPADGKKINLNTAPYEALRTLPVREDLSAFLTQSEAENLIESRSGEDPVSRDEHPEFHVHEQDYRDGDESPFTGASEACDVPYVTIPDCAGVFSRSATVRSRGLFRVVVLGVSLRSNGDTLGVVRLETMVDRRGGTLEVLYRRTR